MLREAWQSLGKALYWPLFALYAAYVLYCAFLYSPCYSCQ
jgi:hypothetical protein